MKKKCIGIKLMKHTCSLLLFSEKGCLLIFRHSLHSVGGVTKFVGSTRPKLVP